MSGQELKDMMGDCGRLICGLHSAKVKPVTSFSFWLEDLVNRTIKDWRDTNEKTKIRKAKAGKDYENDFPEGYNPT